MKIVGLTGGIGAGKSTASSILIGFGAHVVDADDISRAVTAAGGAALPAIREFFGDTVFYADGTLDRRELARRVFRDTIERTALEAIIHPMVEVEIRKEIRNARTRGVEAIVLCIPLLFEVGMDAMCDQTWLISLPRDRQVERLIKRDGFTREEANSRINSQMSQEEKRLRADVEIDNTGDISTLAEQLTAAYNALIGSTGA